MQKKKQPTSAAITLMEDKERRRVLLTLTLLLSLLQLVIFSECEPFIGINYGQMADNLPPPSATARLLESTTIRKVRLYNVNAGIIKALSGTNISIVIGTFNDDIPSLASSPSSASQWLSTNILPFIPHSAISTITVGNEVLDPTGDTSTPSPLYSQLLPAMKNLQAALPPNSGIKISTVHSMAVLAQSYPPSSGSFRPDLADVMSPVLKFLNDHGSPFMINPYPFFAYRDNPTDISLPYCLFRPNPGVLDTNTNLTYTNMFDAQVDAVKSALNSAGFGGVEIVVAETGWPYKGGDNEVGPSKENAMAYNGNLVKHLRSMVGTPLMPNKSVDTYIFALYDEDLKRGRTSESSFGLYYMNSTPIYDAGLMKQVNPPSPQAQMNTPPPPLSRPPLISPPAVNPPLPPLSSPPLMSPPQLHPQPQPPIACTPNGNNNCHVPISASLGTHNLLLFTSIFCRTSALLLSFVFYVSVPLLLLVS